MSADGRLVERGARKAPDDASATGSSRAAGSPAARGRRPDRPRRRGGRGDEFAVDTSPLRASRARSSEADELEQPRVGVAGSRVLVDGLAQERVDLRAVRERGVELRVGAGV